MRLRENNLGFMVKGSRFKSKSHGNHGTNMVHG